MMPSQNRPVFNADSLTSAAIQLPNGACPLPDLASAGQPESVDFQRLADAGYRTIIDLRAPDERRGFDEASAARDAGLAYDNIPVTLQTLADAQFDQLRALLNDPTKRPAVVHCASSNRVGALLIPYLVLDEGRNIDEALAIAARAGLRSQELADVALRYVKDRSGVER